MDYVNSANTGIDGNGNRCFVDLNLATNTPGTSFDQEWFNAVQNEIINAIKASGQTPTDANLSQLLGAFTFFGRKNIAVYATAGTLTFTVPSGVRRGWGRVWGGGGGGGGSVSLTGSAGAGGGGAGFIEGPLDFTVGATLTLTVGAGGAGGNGSGSNGANGGTSSIGSQLTATGGAAGVGSTSAAPAGPAGIGGSASGVGLIWNGLQGGLAFAVGSGSALFQGLGGASFGSGLSYFGVGVTLAGAPGTFPGQGGSGGLGGGGGGAGNAGLLVLEW